MRKHFKIYNVIVGLIFMFGYSFSQDIDINGIILDSDSIVVEGAEILLSNQSVSVKSDSNGVFNILCQSTNNMNYLDKIPQTANLNNHKLSIASTRKNQKLKIKVFNLKGRIVKDVKIDNISIGLYSYNVAWLTSSVSCGLYLLKIDVGKDTFIKKYLKTNKNNVGINKNSKLNKSKLTRRQFAIDTIVVNRANYKTKKVPVNSYSIDLSKIYMEDDTNYIEINEKTKVINDSLFIYINKKSTADSLIINSGSKVFDSLKVGDVIVSGPQIMWPNGILKKVSSIVKLDDKIIVETESAALIDAVDNCNISFSGTLSVDTTDNRGALNISLEKEFLGGMLKTEGSASINIDYSFDIKIEKNGIIPNVKKFEAKYIFDESYDINIVASVSKKYNTSAKVFEKKLSPIYLLVGGFFPMYIQPEFEAYIGATFEVGSNVSFGINNSTTEEIGIKKWKGILVPFFKKTKSVNKFSYSDTDKLITAKIEPFVTGQLNFLFWNMAGPYGGISFYGDGNFEPLANPRWNVNVGINPIVGAKFQFLNNEEFDTSFTPFDINFEQLLAMAGPNNFKCESKDNKVHYDWDTPFDGVDTFYLYASTNPEISKKIYDRKFVYTSEPCSLLANVFDPESTWYFMVTAYNDKEKVESRPSNIDSIAIALDISADRDTAPIIGPIKFTVTTDIDSIDTFEWDFGDGKISNEKDPVHEYDSIGLYTVKCKMIGPNFPEKTIEKKDFINIIKDTLRTYFPSGELKTLAEYTDTLRDSIYRDTINHGYFHEYYINGNNKSFTKYVRSKADSVATGFYDNEKNSVHYTYTLKLGVLDGDHHEYYEDEILKKYIPFKNDEIFGIMFKYFSNGDLEQQLSFEEGESMGLNGELREYYSSTHNLEKEIWYKNDRLNGINRQYTESGVLVYDYTYVNDTLNDTCREYFPSSKMKREIVWNMGIPIGEAFWWDDDDKYLTEVFYNNYGEYHGTITRKFGSFIIDQADYVNGIANGDYRGYFDDGSLKVSGTIEDGAKTGTWEYNCKNGNDSCTYEFTGINNHFRFPGGGRINEDFEITFYYESGNRSYKATYASGIRHGRYFSYYNSDANSVETKGQYENGEMDGWWYSYNPEGEKIDSTYYSN